MEETADNKTIFQESQNRGLILGAIHAVVYVILYFFVPSKITGFSYLFFVIALNIGYTMVQAFGYRKELGGFIDFGQVFQLTFFTMLISGLISSLIIPVALSLADSNFAEVMAQSQFDTSMYWAEKMGAPQATLDEMANKMDMEELKKSYTLVKQCLGFLVACIFYALTGVINGFIVRKSQPETM
jgi:hypothetical protein